MNLLLSKESASCVVACPWDEPVDRQEKYGSIQLKSPSRKRRRKRASVSKESGCEVLISVWGFVRESKSGSKGKSLRRGYKSNLKIKGWDGPGRLLTISNAIDITLHAPYSWIVVGVSKSKGGNGIAVLCLNREEASLRKVIPVTDASDQIAILRGPSILYGTATGVTLMGPNGEGVSLSESISASIHKKSRFIVGSSELDAEAFVLVTEQSAELEAGCSLYSVRYDGTVRGVATVQGSNIGTPERMIVSVRRRLLVLVEEDGGARAIDLRSGKERWRVAPEKERGQVLSLAFYRDLLLMTTCTSEDVWHVPNVSVCEPASSTYSVKRLFSEDCPSVGSTQHRHLFAPWRGLVLQYNEMDGSCCSEQDISNPVAQRNGKKATGGSHLSQVSGNLERRLGMGVERLTETSLRREELMNMLHHSSSLLAEATASLPHIRSTNMFKLQVNNLLMLPRRRLPISNTIPPSEDSEELSQSTRIAVAGQSVLLDSARFVRLIRSSCGLDRSRHFIIVQVHVAMLDSSTAVDEGKPSTLALRLNVQFDRCIATLWNVQEKDGLHSGDVQWLTAYAPVASLVTGHSPALANLSISVRVDANDGRSQPLGMFSMASALSLKADLGMNQIMPWKSGRSTIEQKLCAIACGPSAHRLRRLMHVSAASCNIEVRTREGLACVTFTATSGVEIAMAIAKMKACVDDDVTLRSSPQLSRSSLGQVDSALTALDEEVRLLRSITSNRASVGYTADQTKQMLWHQLLADEAMGHLEEELLGT